MTTAQDEINFRKKVHRELFQTILKLNKESMKYAMDYDVFIDILNEIFFSLTKEI
jgi:O-phosphoseryl-tRNA(Cys) synthetase